MKYSHAKPEDIDKWLEVADDVGEVMRVPDMRNNSNFLIYANRKLAQNNAIMAFDEIANECAGFIGFSHTNNSITWLGVKNKYRNQGVGSKLISLVLSELNKNKIVTVNTYPGNYLPGGPARRLYFKHGFAETSGDVFLIDDLEMVELFKKLY